MADPKANVVVYPRKQMTAQDFALLIETLTTNVSGVIYGCELTYTGNVVHVAAGWCVCRGRMIRVDAGDITITPSGTAGDVHVYIQVDLSNTARPGVFMVTSEAQDDSENFNVINGTAYVEIGTVTLDTTSVTGVTSAAKIVPVSQRTRNIYVSTQLPTVNDGNDGDVWLVYSP